MVKSIERGLFESAFCGAQQSGAYCEVTIKGKPHVVDLRLVRGYSSLDHMADLPLAAIVRAVSGKDFVTVATLKKVGQKTKAKALAGGPRIDWEVKPGCLKDRWLQENLQALQDKLGKDYSVPSRSNLYQLKDGRWRLCCESKEGWGYCCATTDDPFEPECVWEIGKDHYYD